MSKTSEKEIIINILNAIESIHNLNPNLDLTYALKMKTLSEIELELRDIYETLVNKRKNMKINEIQILEKEKLKAIRNMKYTVKVPKTKTDLKLTGQKFKNCIGGDYFEDRLLKTTNSLLMILNNTYCVWIDKNKGKILEAKKKQNQHLNPTEFDKIKTDLKTVFKN